MVEGTQGFGPNVSSLSTLNIETLVDIPNNVFTVLNPGQYELKLRLTCRIEIVQRQLTGINYPAECKLFGSPDIAPEMTPAVISGLIGFIVPLHLHRSNYLLRSVPTYLLHL